MVQFGAILMVLSLAGVSTLVSGKSFDIVLTTNTAPAGCIEINGVEADAFNPRLWESNKLNFVPDIRTPLLSPQPGKFRNIYAPSAVQTPGGYRIFYGAWDGIPSGNDHIYSTQTDENFQSFIDRHLVLSPDGFQHVCNVNAIRLNDGAFALYATVYPVDGQNRPGFFKSDSSGTNWNGRIGEPCTVQLGDVVDITGYNYTNSDINGVNVMLREDGQYRLYFDDFHGLPGVFRASSEDGKHYRFEARVFSGNGAINDLKEFRVGASTYYLMGLHENGARLWFSLSTNALAFPPAQVLFTNATADERYIVALGWVTRGSEELPGRKLLGVLYGAGPAISLDHNKIFARWLQKRAVFVTSDGKRLAGTQAQGPDRQFLQISNRDLLQGHFEIYAEDGETLLGAGPVQEVRMGQSYRLAQP